MPAKTKRGKRPAAKVAKTANDDIDRLAFERKLLSAKTAPVAGVDEAGRGPLAGPVVAAAVVLPAEFLRAGLPESLAGLNDSKQLTEKRRERLFAALHEIPEIQKSVAVVSAAVIDEINILQATHRAMNEALAGLPETPAHTLVDGNPVKSLTTPQTAIVKGDSLSFTIAAASILAKVTRDRMMLAFDEEFPGYGFAKHKGYGTKQHLAAIAELGPTPIHRLTFAPLKPPAPRDPLR